MAGTPNRLVPNEFTVQFPAKSLEANTHFIRDNKDDIAIIRLKGEIPEDNRNIKIMKMPSGPPPYDSNCTIIGWGRMIKVHFLDFYDIKIKFKLLVYLERSFGCCTFSC